MKLLNVSFNTRQLNKILNNVVRYSDGFIDGIEIDKLKFMTELGEYTVKIFNQFVDSQARVSPQSLHHVYEWGQVGSPGGRLFEIEPIPGPEVIRFSGRFLASDSISDTATESFIYKAETMESGISITVAPKFADYLKFDINGETVFTMNEVTIAHPGGPSVAGSFGRVTDKFFNQYFGKMHLQALLRELATAEEYAQYFPEGARGGYSVGIRAGKIYLSSAGVKGI